MIRKILTLIITIIIIIAIIIWGIKFIWGENGVLTKVTVDEVEWNKSEVLEEINMLLAPIYIDAHKTATETKVSIDELYSSDIVIDKLKEMNVIKDYIDIDGKEVEKKYYIDVNELKGDISQYGTGENGTRKRYIYIRMEQ